MHVPAHAAPCADPDADPDTAAAPDPGPVLSAAGLVLHTVAGPSAAPWRSCCRSAGSLTELKPQLALSEWSRCG